MPLRGQLLPVLGLALAYISSCSANLCYPVQAKPSSNFTQLSDLHACKGVGKWTAFGAIWTPLRVHISCSTPDYSVFLGRSESELEEALEHNDALVWCGMAALSDSRNCTRNISPYGTTLVGIKIYDGFIPRLSIGQARCHVHGAAVRNDVLPLLFLAGVLLFWFADALSTSATFRISAGTSVFVATSLGLLLVLAIRMIPHRRAVISSLVAAGSTALGILRWLYGHWLPSISTILRSPWFIAYVTVSAVIGSAVTYYFDDPRNEKLNNILRAALHVLGLLLVACGTTTWEASAGTMVLLVLAFYVQGVVRLHHVARLLLLPFRLLALLATLPVQLARWLRSKLPKSVAAKVREAAAVPLPGDDDAAAVSPAAGPGLASYLAQRKRAEAAGGTLSAAAATTPPSAPGAGAGRSPAGPFKFNVSPPLSPAAKLALQQQLGTPQQQHGQGEEEEISPLVKRGLILNPETGKNLKIGGPTYNKLLLAGYSPDARRGELMPPSSAGASAGSRQLHLSQLVAHMQPSPAVSGAGETSSHSRRSQRQR